jgi:hypothetical protein
MFSADEKTIAELRDLRECLAAVDHTEATALGLALDGELNRHTPDLTGVLLKAADSASRHSLALGRILMAACCRAFCARLGELHPGASIEVRVPPWAAVQVGFGDGPKHTRGTPPNVVEMEPSALLGLATGRLCWAEAEVKVSGSQAERVAAIFPITAP